MKAAYTLTLLTLVQTLRLGRFVLDRMRLVHPGANLSAEPDGLFFTWETVRSGRLRFVEGSHEGCLELEGTPDMVLEILSRTSERKDTEVLPVLYGRAGIPEYWLVDARGEQPRFDILRHTDQGYQPVPVRDDGWVTSAVFGHEFRLVRESDPLGHPEFRLEARPIE